MTRAFLGATAHQHKFTKKWHPIIYIGTEMLPLAKESFDKKEDADKRADEIALKLREIFKQFGMMEDDA